MIKHKNWPFLYEYGGRYFDPYNYENYKNIKFTDSFGPFLMDDTVDEVDIAGYHFTYRIKNEWKNLNLNEIYPVTLNKISQNLTNDLMKDMCNP